ncbi:MAG: hypothetical protein KatS3mg001_048 [Candidatus Pacearchaeota archaeon]|nr:MAG: hypothetical protein KatS3mg001_048 [Candidatus Pacearchaeota archaeon]
MKRGIIFLSLVFLVLLVNFASAINLKIEKKSSGEILIADVNNPVVFELSVTNLGPSDNFIFYNLVGFRNFPEEPVFISQAETKNITLEILPLRQLLERGYYTITIYVKSQKDNSVIREDLTFKIIDLKDAFEVGATDISPSSTETLFFIKNRGEL